jgi:hypothetical protein
MLDSCNKRNGQFEVSKTLSRSSSASFCAFHVCSTSGYHHKEQFRFPVHNDPLSDVLKYLRLLIFLQPFDEG